MECPVCMDSYDAERRRPKVLPCGHSVCLECLTDPGFQRRCPQDRKAFDKEPQQLCDNIAIISALTEYKNTAPQREICWCRDCSKELSAACLDAGHQACSLRQLRAEERQKRSEELAPQVLQLQQGIAAMAALRPYLDAVEEALKQLDEWRARSRPLEEALESLLAAADDGVGVEEAVVTTAPQLVVSVDLVEAARLATLRGKYSVKLEAEDGNAWAADGDLSLLTPRVGPLLRLLLLQMLVDGLLNKPFSESQAAVSATPSSSKDGASPTELDMSRTPRSGMTSEQILDLLREDHLANVRVVKGLDCSDGSNVCTVLLQRLAPRLAELAMTKAELPHLRVLPRMTALRKLDLSCSFTGCDAPGLPPTLEDLTISRASTRHLLSLAAMPRLRRLAIMSLYTSEGQQVLSKAVPATHCGLQRLKLQLRQDHKDTMLSLIKAHAATLQELEIRCDTNSKDFRDRDLFLFGSLSEELGRCGLTALRRLVLLRGGRERHTTEACRRQVCELFEALLRSDGSGNLACVDVVCSWYDSERGECVEPSRGSKPAAHRP